MRIKTTAAIVALALVGAIAVSVTGQQDPLPVVLPKGAEIPIAAPTIVLAVEPIREPAPPTMLEAARANDYVSFNALYTAARDRGEDVSQFATLHALWSWSVSDPIGAFYGAEWYDKLNRAYPGYAAYIAAYRIVDDHGNVFYPTSETRAFLLGQKISPVVRPSVAPRRASREPAREPAPARTPTRRSASRVAVKEPVAPRVAIKAQPQVKVAETQPPAQIAESKPQPQAAAPQTAPPQTAAPQTAAPQPPIVAPQPQVQVQQQPAAQPVTPPQTSPLAGRGVLLLIIGLIGIGLLAVILRTPREAPPAKIIQPQPPANVEPMRKPDAKPDSKTPGDHRAAG